MRLDFVVGIDVEGGDADHRIDAGLFNRLNVVNEVLAAFLDQGDVLLAGICAAMASLRVRVQGCKICIYYNTLVHISVKKNNKRTGPEKLIPQPVLVRKNRCPVSVTGLLVP